MRSRKKVYAAVGEDITTPAGVARNGRLRIRSVEAAEVARWFGLEKEKGGANKEKGKTKKETRDIAAEIALAPGTITLITGASGAGKSSLLRELRRRHAATRRWIDLGALRAGNVPIVSCFDGQPLTETLKLLARVGLGEAWSYLRTPAELSDGQRFRFRLALGLWCAGGEGKRKNEKGKTEEDLGGTQQTKEDGAIVACDEFAATLDRLTAMIVSRCLRRTIDAHPHIAAVLATSHDDLIEALSPDVVVRCDFGKVEMEPRINADERG